MRLRPVGPGIGGLNYSPLLRDVPQRERSAAPALLGRALAAHADRSDCRPTLWQALAAGARRMGRRVVDARMAQAERLIEVESRRLFGRETGPFNGDAFGSRYY